MLLHPPMKTLKPFDRLLGPQKFRGLFFKRRYAPKSIEDYDHVFGGNITKVIISSIPNHLRLEDFESWLVSSYGASYFEKINSRDPDTLAVQVTFETNEQAQHAVNELNGFLYEGAQLKAELCNEKRGGGRGGGGGMRGPRAGGAFAMGGSGRQTDFPLRILVQSDMVGAIIGRQGSTIKQITQQSRARVDVHRKENVGSLEKAITIYGNPENCTNACKRILEVMKQEAVTNNKGDITLKVLAHNNLIGRIIGKSGNTIKRIMQETDTKITVSSINDINSFNLERIITVKGSIDNMSKAESLISAKLKQSYENDLQAMAPQTMMFPGLHPMAMMATGMGFNSRGPGGYQGGLYPSACVPPVYQPLAPGGSHSSDAQVQNLSEEHSSACETTYLYIPNNAVGAIIGTKGSHIRSMIRFSNASVRIEAAELGKEERDGQPAERKVTITGSPESQWKAQYLIFEKMREEGFMSGTDEVRLTVEIMVPSSQVGRIIGKGGQNVRELQRVTGSIIKLPEQGTGQPQEAETTVHIIGPFFSVQSAQRRIRAMVGSAATAVGMVGRQQGGGGPRGGSSQYQNQQGSSSSGGGQQQQQQQPQQQQQQQQMQSGPQQTQ